MVNSKSISIIVPVYNTEEYLDKCLDSLVKQTLQGIEIIIINDGSTDGSYRIIDEYKKNHPDKIKAYTIENRGPGGARNYGIRKASGRYLGFVDSDDYVDAFMFEKLFNKAEREASDIVVCGYVRHLIKKDKKIFILQNEIFDKSVKENAELLLCSRAFFCNKLIKKDLFFTNDIFFPEDQFFEDDAIIYEILFHAEKISCVDEPLYYYRLDRDGSTVNTVDPRIFDIFKSCDRIAEFYSKQPDYKEKYYPAVERICQMHLFARIKTLLKGRDKKIAFDYFDQMYSWLKNNFPDWRKNCYYRKKREVSKRYILKYILIKHKMLLKCSFLMKLILMKLR